MGDSSLASEIAFRLDAGLLPSIVNDGHLDLLESALGDCEGHVKVAFIN